MVENLNPAIEGREPISYRAPSVFVGRLLRDPDKRVNALVKAGYAALDTNAAERVVKIQRHDAQFAWGATLQIGVSPASRLELVYERYDQDAKRLGLGFRYEF